MMGTDDTRKHEDEISGGAYIGNRPELASETIPGGVDPDEDERVAAHDSRSSGEGRQDERVEGRRDDWPAGHREADSETSRRD